MSEELIYRKDEDKLVVEKIQPPTIEVARYTLDELQTQLSYANSDLEVAQSNVIIAQKRVDEVTALIAKLTI